jgi:acetoin utilization protein AcuB
MNVEDIMVRNVFALETSATIADFLKVLKENKFRHVPVIDEAQHVVGVLSERDQKSIELALNVFDDTNYENNILQTNITEMIETDPVSVQTGTHIKEAMNIMIEKKYSALPVVENKHLTGIISYVDLLNVFCDWQESIPAS